MCRVSASSEVRRGANSVIVTGLSAIDSELYCIKFFGQAEALAAEEAMLGHRDLALVLPPARYVDSKEHKQALQGPVMVSRPGKALDLLLSDDPHLLSSPVTLVRRLLHSLAWRCDICMYETSVNLPLCTALRAS